MKRPTHYVTAAFSLACDLVLKKGESVEVATFTAAQQFTLTERERLDLMQAVIDHAYDTEDP